MFLLNFDLVHFGRGMSGIHYSQGEKIINVTLVAYFQELIMVTPKKIRAARAIFPRAVLISSMGGRLESRNRGPRVSNARVNFLSQSALVAAWFYNIHGHRRK
jgi:hypothetical protein